MKKDIKMIIAGNLAELRKERGLSQSTLAEQVSLSTEFISQVERGASFPSIQSLEKLAEALDVKMGFFFDDPEDMDSWDIEIEALVILMKNKRGKSIRKVYKLAEALDKFANHPAFP